METQAKYPNGMLIPKDMLLPEGKTCKDCFHFERCEWLIQCKPNRISCDWSPSRFVEVKK